MEHLEEINKLTSDLARIAEYQNRAKTIIVDRRDLVIRDNYNDRYTMLGLRYVIGEDKFDAIVEQFKGLLEVELHRISIQKRQELGKYKIEKLA